MTLGEILAQYPLPIAIAIWATVELLKLLYRILNAKTEKLETDTKQDDTITNFSIEFNAERRQLQESNNKLSAELMEVRLVQATEAGRREQLEKSMMQERTEWKNERGEFNEKFRKMEARILELENHQSASRERIKQLEAQIELKDKQIAEADKEIALLQAQKRELENQLTREVNRANALSELIEKLQAHSTDATQALPDVDETVITEPQTVTTGNTETKEDDAA